MTIHVFNPENDMALADGRPGFTPPALIRQMREELHWLPTWWADEGDTVWDGRSRLDAAAADRVRPWGWSPALAHRLRLAGVPDRLLPDKAELDTVRALSHRATAVEALRRFKEDNATCRPARGDTRLCHTWEEAREAIARHPRALMKQPWSGSGRGLKPAEADDAERWCRNTLRAQGAVVVEERLEKLADFALEFELDGAGGVEYTGLSLFYTDRHGAYAGNWVAAEGEKLAWLARYAPPQELAATRAWWERYLSAVPYRGPVGVDMMLCPDGLCPCVEINWRMTMGMVANLCARQGRRGRLVVEHIYGHFSAEVEAFG